MDKFQRMQQKCIGCIGQRGFVLLATLFALVVISIMAAYFAGRVAQIRDAAGIEMVSVEAETDFASFRAKLSYAANINVVTARGLEQGATDMLIREAHLGRPRLALDGAFHQLDTQTGVAVQDERGLLNINLSPELTLRRFMTLWDIPAAQHNVLVDTLYDYIDGDDTKRLNGAESSQYRAQNLPEPSNAAMTNVLELNRIPVWQTLLEGFDKQPGRKQQFLAEMSVGRLNGLNANTAPRRVLDAADAFESNTIDALIAARLRGEIISWPQLDVFLRRKQENDEIAIFPSRDWIVQFDRAGLPFLLKCRLRIQSYSIEQPVFTDACSRQERLSRGSSNQKSTTDVEVPSIDAKRPAFPIALVESR